MENVHVHQQCNKYREIRNNSGSDAKMRTRSLKRKRDDTLYVLEENFPQNWDCNLTILICEYYPVLNFKSEELVEIAKSQWVTTRASPPEKFIPTHIYICHNLFLERDYQENLMKELESTFSCYLEQKHQNRWSELYQRAMKIYEVKQDNILKQDNFIRTFIPLFFKIGARNATSLPALCAYKLLICVTLIVVLQYHYFRFYITFLEKYITTRRFNRYLSSSWLLNQNPDSPYACRLEMYKRFLGAIPVLKPQRVTATCAKWMSSITIDDTHIS
jgi:hypothetical protein